MGSNQALRREERFGQPSFVFKNESVEVSVTEQGGMTAPVIFSLPGGKSVSPYYVSPWQTESEEPDEPVLKALRGDFFCLPFGANHELAGEDHAVHGEAAGARWTAGALGESGDRTSFAMTLDYTATKGSLTKELHIRSGENVLYAEHTLSGFSGAYPLGHHATLAGGDRPGELAISVKPFDLGENSPEFSWFQAGGEYCSLQPGKQFTDLEAVPTIWKDEPATDCSTFPNRRGFVDVMAVYRRPRAQDDRGGRLSWTCAVNENQGWLWFSLKDANLLPGTVFWMENHGRHQPPWNGRNCCIGLEEVCAFFTNGRSDSVAENPVAAEGIPTAFSLSPDKNTRIPYIQGMAAVPEGFGKVTTLSTDAGTITLGDGSGKSVTVPVAWEFLFDGVAAFG